MFSVPENGRIMSFLYSVILGHARSRPLKICIIYDTLRIPGLNTPFSFIEPLASALKPVYFRFGGTSCNFITFQANATKAISSKSQDWSGSFILTGKLIFLYKTWNVCLCVCGLTFESAIQSPDTIYHIMTGDS